MKQSGGSPGHRLKFADKREHQTGSGKVLILHHTDPDLNLPKNI
jgi:hypothetical protein